MITTEPRVALRALVDETACARALSKSLSWIRKDRLGRKTIPFVRVAGSVRYDMDRVMAVVMATEEGGPKVGRNLLCR